jgi:threonine/homoserine/homoserine lactone efflux protein
VSAPLMEHEIALVHPGLAMSFVAVSVIAFVVAFVGSLPLAGPVALLVVSNGASRRYKDALRIALGAALAEGIYAFIAFWGFATFLARHALVLPISHGVTAVIMCGLGVRFLFFKLKGRSAKAPKEADSGRFWVGFSISAVNPTLLATWGAVTTFLYSNQIVRFTGLLAIPFGVCAAAGIAVWGLMVVGLLERFGKRVPNAVLTWVVRSMGIVMICVGLWSFVALGKYVLDRNRHLDVRGATVSNATRVRGVGDCNASAWEVSPCRIP